MHANQKSFIDGPRKTLSSCCIIIMKCIWWSLVLESIINSESVNPFTLSNFALISSYMSSGNTSSTIFQSCFCSSKICCFAISYYCRLNERSAAFTASLFLSAWSTWRLSYSILYVSVRWSCFRVILSCSKFKACSSNLFLDFICSNSSLFCSSSFWSSCFFSRVSPIAWSM